MGFLKKLEKFDKRIKELQKIEEKRVKEEQRARIKEGTEGKYQYVYIEPNDSVVVYANALRFDESISFSGKGAAVNNYILQQSNEIDKQTELMKRFHTLPPILYKETIDSLYEVKK